MTWAEFVALPADVAAQAIGWDTAVAKVQETKAELQRGDDG